MITPLAKCNNCDFIYVDTNPSTDQKEYDIPTDLVGETLIKIKYEDGTTHFHGCPTCNTDGYLIDFEGELCENEYGMFECNPPITLKY